MFTCLEILPGKEGLFTKIYEKIRPPYPEREFVQLHGGTPFLRLKVRENHVDWRKISLSLSGKERQILTESSVSVPENAGFERCVPKSLGLNIMLRTFITLAEDFKKPEKLSVSVYDKNGSAVENLKTLVPHVRNISVYTEKIKEYFYLSSEIMEEWGMCVKINEYTSHAFPEKIIIGDEYNKDMGKASLVFLGDNSIISYNTVTGGDFPLDNEYRTLKSNNIDDFTFASALYEYNGVHLLEERKFASHFLAGREISKSDLAQRLCVL